VRNPFRARKGDFTTVWIGVALRGLRSSPLPKPAENEPLAWGLSKGVPAVLGERSRGLPDPGATNCRHILSVMADECTKFPKTKAGTEWDGAIGQDWFPLRSEAPSLNWCVLWFWHNVFYSIVSVKILG